jgi:hypothetical protein
MTIKVNKKSVDSQYVVDDYIPAIIVIGKECNDVRFVEWHRDDTGLLELQLDSSSGEICQVTLTASAHNSFSEGRLPIPETVEEGTLIPDLPRETEASCMSVAVYSDGVSIQLLPKIPMRFVRSGDVVFCISADDDIAGILLTNLTKPQLGHTKDILAGVGFEPSD